jgi:ubiquinone biosynthesis protein COQ9
VRLRLTQAEGEREALKALMAWFAFPAHQACAAACLYRTVDTIWHVIGDTSTDFNFYTKRAILAGVLAATVLYWLGDESEGAAESFVFLDRCIDDVMAFEKAKGRAREWLAELPDPFRILRDVTARGGKRDDDGPVPGAPKP